MWITILGIVAPLLASIVVAWFGYLQVTSNRRLDELSKQMAEMKSDVKELIESEKEYRDKYEERTNQRIDRLEEELREFSRRINQRLDFLLFKRSEDSTP